MATLPRGGTVHAVGESHYQDALLAVVGGRTRHSVEHTCLAELCPEPTNPYDDEAIAVQIGGQCVGYLSRADARTFRPLVDSAIASAGRATVEACVRGGWDRGAGDVGHLGVVLFFSDRPDGEDEYQPPPQLPEPGEDEIRLRGSATVSVSNEEHYQEALVAAYDVSRYTTSVLAELTEVPANPHAKKDSGPVLQVSINRVTVGHLTPAMTERLRRMTNRAQAEGRRLTCSAQIFRGEKRGQPLLEIRLSAVPHAHDETVVVDPYFQIALDLVRIHRSSKVHRISTTDQTGNYRTACGVTIAAHDGRLMGSTKPWVGDIDPTTRAIIADAEHCSRCQ